jgi:HK97 family phage portal protein
MDRIFANLFRKREVAAPSAVPTTTAPHASEEKPKGGNWQSNVVRPYGKSSLLVPAWYRGVSLIMQTMGQMVTQYQYKNLAGNNFVEARGAKNSYFNYLLQVRPNPMMTASQMQEQIEYRKIYKGNAYVYIEREPSGYPRYMWLCTGGGYDPLSNTYNLVYNSDRGPRMAVNADAHDVLHFKNVFLTDDYYMGIPTLDFAFKSLSIAATADDQALQDVAKGGRYKILIQEKDAPSLGTRGRVNQAELKRATKQFGDDWNANDFVMLDNMASATQISQTSRDLQLLESRQFSVSDLARILGVPRIMMMEDAGSSYKMPEHATQEFMLRTIQPRIREWEDEMNSKLLLPGDFGSHRIHVCELPLRRLDAKGQAEIDKLHLETGWSANEIRGQYDLPDIPDGDKHYLTAAVAEVGSAKLRDAVAGGRPKEPAAKGSDEEDDDK